MYDRTDARGPLGSKDRFGSYILNELLDQWGANDDVMAKVLDGEESGPEARAI